MTLPQVGKATFGRGRRRRQARVAALPIPPAVLMIALLMRGELGAVIPERQVLVGLDFGGVSLVLFNLMAHWLEFPRLHDMAVVYTAAFPIAEWLDAPVVLIIVPGTVLFERLVRRNPCAAADHHHA